MSRKRILLMGDQRVEGYGSVLMETFPDTVVFRPDTVFRHRKLGGIRSMDEVPSKTEILKDIYRRESFSGLILLMYNEELIDDSQSVSLYRMCFQIDQIVEKTQLFVKEIHKIDSAIRVLVTIPSVVDLQDFNNSFCAQTSKHILNTYRKNEEIGRKHIEELYHRLLNEKFMEVLSLEKCIPSWAYLFRQNLYQNGLIPKREGPVPSLFAIYVQDLFGLKYPAAKLMSSNDIWHDSAQSIRNFHPKRFREDDLRESNREEIQLPEHNESLVPHFSKTISWLEATKLLSDIGFHIDPDTYPATLPRGEKVLPLTEHENVFPQVPSEFSSNVPSVSRKKRRLQRQETIRLKRQERQNRKEEIANKKTKIVVQEKSIYGEEEPITVEEKPISVEEIPFSVEEKHISVEEKPISAKEKKRLRNQRKRNIKRKERIANKKTKIVVQEKSITVEEKHISVEDKHISVEDKHISVEDKHISVEDKHISVEDKHISVEDKHISVEDKPISVEEKERKRKAKCRKISFP